MTSRVMLEWKSQQAAGLVNEDGDDIKVNVLNEFRLWVDRNDASLTPCLLNEGFWESWITIWFINNVKPGMTVVDVGANFGYFTMLANNLVGPEGRVIAYEANPAIARLLERTKSDNQANFEIRNVALADKPGQLVLSYPGEYMGSASLVVDFEGSTYGPASHIEVEAVPLDDEPVDHVDVIKIDAESAEEIIWNGAGRILNGPNPPVVLLEYSSTGYYSDKFVDTLMAYGTVEAINGDGETFPVSKEHLDTLTDWEMLVITP